MQISKYASIYLSTSIVQRAIPFLLLPILTRYLSPGEYGILAIYQVAINFCMPFIGMAMHINVSRNFARVSHEEMGRWIGNLFSILCFTTGIVTILFTAYLLLKRPTFGIPPVWFMTVPIVAGLSMAHQINLTVLRNQERPLAFGAVTTSNTLLNLTVSIVLIIVFSLGWQGRGIGIISAALTFSSIGFLYLRRQGMCTFVLSAIKVKEIFKICLPLIPHAMGIAVITMSDRLFIDHMVGKKAVGVYTVGYTFGMTVNLFVESFSRAWSPWFFRQITDTSRGCRLKIIRYSYGYFLGILLVAVAVTGASYLVLPYMVGTEFHGATRFIPWIAVGYAFRGMYTIVFPYLVSEAKTQFLSIMTVVAAIFNLGGNHILINVNGPVGAAQSTLLAFALSFLGTWWYANRIYPMPWHPRGLTNLEVLN